MSDFVMVRRTGIGVFAAGLALALAGQGLAQTRDKPKGSDKSSPRRADANQRNAGVIVKVENIDLEADKASSGSKTTKEGAGRRPILRLTINTDAVWRDWARDQVQTKDVGSTKTDAKKGNNSVATKGEPAETNSLVIIDLLNDSKVETRFRALEDETSRGSKEPEGKTRSDSAKPVDFQMADLKEGLYVEVDYTIAKTRILADRVSVIRPIAGSK